MIVRRELDAIGKPGGHIFHERRRVAPLTATDQIRHDQFFSVARGPRPHVASAFRGGLGIGHELGFRVAERTNLVALDPFRRDVANCLVMEIHARVAGLNQQLGNGVDSGARDLRDRTNAVAVAKIRS